MTETLTLVPKIIRDSVRSATDAAHAETVPSRENLAELLAASDLIAAMLETCWKQQQDLLERGVEGRTYRAVLFTFDMIVTEALAGLREICAAFPEPVRVQLGSQAHAALARAQTVHEEVGRLTSLLGDGTPPARVRTLAEQYSGSGAESDYESVDEILARINAGGDL